MNWKFWQKKIEPESYPVSDAQQRHWQRNYKAGKESRLLSGWTSAPVPINQTIKNQLTSLRARSREQAQQNDYAKHFIRILQNNVIGSAGFSIQAQTMRNGQLDDPANQAIEDAYKDAGRSVDITGRLSRHDNLRLILSSLVTDGEYVAIEHFGSQYPYGRKIEVVDPELLDVTRNFTKKNGNEVRLGIEYNKQNQPVSYYFKQYNTHTQTYSKAEDRIVPANRVHHIFFPEFVGQERGIPWLATSLFSLKSLDAYHEAAITAARIGASKMGFFRSEIGEEYTGETIQDDGSMLTDVEPGTLENIGAMTFQQFDPTYPHEQFPHFNKVMLRKYSSGIGAQYESIANDREGVNYTSIRHGTLEDRENWKVIQEFLVNQWVKPDFEFWLDYALMSQAIKIGKRPLSRAFDDYKSVKIQPRRWDWVDPLKDMDAYTKEHELKVISISEIIRSKGRDPEEVFRQIAADKQRLEELGISESEVLNA